MLSEMSERFPETYIYVTFVISACLVVAKTALMAYLVRDAWRHRRSDGVRLRWAGLTLLSGHYAWRVYSTYALWRYHWPNVPVERLAVDIYMAVTFLAFAWLWLRRRKGD